MEEGSDEEGDDGGAHLFPPPLGSGSCGQLPGRLVGSGLGPLSSLGPLSG